MAVNRAGWRIDVHAMQTANRHSMEKTGRNGSFNGIEKLQRITLPPPSIAIKRRRVPARARNR